MEWVQHSIFMGHLWHYEEPALEPSIKNVFQEINSVDKEEQEVMNEQCNRGLKVS